MLPTTRCGSSPTSRPAPAPAATVRPWPRSVTTWRSGTCCLTSRWSTAATSRASTSPRARRRVELVGPPLADTSTNGFKLADFQLDRDARRAVYPPAGSPPSGRCGRSAMAAAQSRSASELRTAPPARSDPSAPPRRGGRNLSLSEHYERLVARRAEAQTPAFRARLATRAGIEATLSELVRRHGLRRHRYRGDAKRHFEHLLKAAACNLKRLARALAARQHARGPSCSEPCPEPHPRSPPSHPCLANHLVSDSSHFRPPAQTRHHPPPNINQQRHHGRFVRRYTCASSLSASGNQKVIPISRSMLTAVDSSGRASSARPIRRYSFPSPRWQCA